jgi:transposase
MQDIELENCVITMYNRGCSMRSLSARFSISRGRVKRIIQKNQKGRETENISQAQEKKARGSKLDPYKEQVHGLLESYKDITNQRIYELVQQEGYQGKISTLRDYLVHVRGKKTSEPIYCVETRAGQRGSHDWGQYKIQYTETNIKENTVIFSFILNYSRRQYMEVVEDMGQTTLLNCLINAFIYFDGVPLEIKSDNQKNCVERWEDGRPIFNRNFLGFANHYQFKPLAIRPGKPSENLKIERPFYYFETNFLNGRSFMGRQDLKEQLQQWLIYHNDTRLHRTTRQRPIDLYGHEISCLQALPGVHYDTGRFGYRIVNNESAIEWDGYFYMVPKEYMHETCPVRATVRQLSIYSPGFMLIKQYPLAAKGSKEKYIGRHKTEGAPKTGDKPEELAQRLGKLGPIMQKYLQELKANKPKNYLYHLRAILSLKAQYYNEDIINAVSRALQYKVYEASSIENFLQGNAQKKNEIR